MTVVSSSDFVANQQKYFNMAVNEEVFIKNEGNMFHLAYTTIDDTSVKERVYYEPDEDFYRSISMDELLGKVKEHIYQLYANK